MSKLSTADALSNEVDSVRHLYQQAAKLRELADAALEALVERARDEDGVLPGDPRAEDYFNAYAQMVDHH